MTERIVFTRPDGGVSVVAPTGKVDIGTVMIKDVPKDSLNARIVTADQIPVTRIYRNAWDDSNPEDFVGVNLDKAKVIAHARRRANRDIEFKPYDDVLAKGIPGQDQVAAEASRFSIRNKYDALQVEIDGCVDVTALEAKEKEHGLL